MEFNCLWLTNSTEFKLWKKNIENFPFPLVHHFYEDLSEESLPELCSLISICIWSEKEYPKVQKRDRDYLLKNKKPSLFIIKISSFAVNAFKFGFEKCIDQKHLDIQLESSLIDLLKFYFKPEQKASFLKNKIWIPTDMEQEALTFIPLDQTVYIAQDKKNILIKTTQKEFKTKLPLSWVSVQCQIDPLIWKINPNLFINSIHIKSITPAKNNKYDCLMMNNENIKLNTSEFRKIKHIIDTVL